VDYVYIDSLDALGRAGVEWGKARLVGVDLECENCLHYYGTFIALIQISTREKNWIIDVLSLQQIEPVLEMLENPGIEKIFHDASFDVRILSHQFNCCPRNIFDTQIAALLLGKEKLGLEDLLMDVLGVSCTGDFQMADWTRRPLPEKMLAYAVCDTAYIIRLKEALCTELEKLGRLPWLQEELELLNGKKLTLKKSTYQDLRGIRTLSGRERSILKTLFSLREEMAKKTNKPPYQIIRNGLLMDLARNPPDFPEEWTRLRGVHPIIRRNAYLFFEAVKKAAKSEVSPPPAKPKRHYTPQQSMRLEKLSELCDSVSEELGIEKHLVLGREQMHNIAVTNSLDCLKKWQKKLLEKKINVIL
jgi:ribonuclease D